MSKLVSYASAIREAFHYLLSRYPEVFVIGQGLWSPWYVGSSMKDLDREFGTERIIDTPVSELACTGTAIGASLFGYRPIVVHPRMDFMLLAVDQIVNQAAKWRHMLGGAATPAVTIRGIINRGGEQGAQHSQALHAWFAHIPGLRVVVPATPSDARDLLIASVLCDDPVIYIDDRWLYGLVEELSAVTERDLRTEGPGVRRPGTDLTIVGAGYSAHLACQAAEKLAVEAGIEAEVVDVRVVSPLDARPIVHSVRRTGRLLVVDGGWAHCGLARSIVAEVVETLDPSELCSSPVIVTLPAAPAPTSRTLERLYYPGVEEVVKKALGLCARRGCEGARAVPSEAAQAP